MASFFRFFVERHLLAYFVTIMILLPVISTLMDIKRDTDGAGDRVGVRLRDPAHADPGPLSLHDRAGYPLDLHTKEGVIDNL